MKEKQCVSCKAVKRIECFSKNRNSKDGYKNYCKSCASEQNRRYRQRHKEKINARNREWYRESKKNKEDRTKKELEKGYKVCNNCKKTKKITDYYERGNGGFYGECKECHNKKAKIYQENNREKVLSRKRMYYQENRERFLEYFKKYSFENSRKNVERSKKWREQNPERYNELMRLAQNRRRAKKSKVINNFTRGDWKYCKEFFKNSKGMVECAYCNKEMINATQDHFIPIHKGGNHTPDNIVPACHSCNSKKSASDFHEWYPSMPFYSEKNIKKIKKYFNTIKQNQDNHEPSL